MKQLTKNFGVTGLSQYSFARYVKDVRVGSTLTLRHDPKNRYDKNATGVFYNGTQIGWIRKAENKFLAELLKTNNISELPVKVLTFRVGKPIWKSILVIEVSTLIQNSNLIKEAVKDGWSDVPLYVSNTCSEISLLGEPINNITAAPEFKNQFVKEYFAEKPQTYPKETKMEKLMNTNKSVATQAAFNEAGRVFLNQVTKAIAKQAPLMVKGYVDTPAGKLAIANATVMAVQHFRPADIRLNKLANAALGQAYQELYQTFDIEKFIENFLNNESIKAALQKVSEDE